MIVGIDVSKDKLDIHVSSENKYFVIKNTQPSIASFMKNKLSKLGEPKLVVFESTGGYEKQLQLYLLRHSVPYHKAHPNKVYHFGKSRGYFAKTDRIDAQMLSQYGMQDEIVSDQQDSEEQIKIQELSGRKTQLKEQIAKETQRLKHDYLNKIINRSIKRTIKMLQKELGLIEAELEALIITDEKLSKRRKLLKTVKGVGDEVSTLLITDLPELGFLSREEISSLVGVAPQTKDSGKKKGYRSISRGRFYVRKGLYMAALVASRYNPRMKLIYQKLLSQGKKKKVALVAVMRKMLIMMNAMLKNQTPWQSTRI